MKLDIPSLDKLLDLMIMIFKWQLYLISQPDDLLSLTLRHLHGIGRLMPEKHKMIIIDQANQYFFTSWNEFQEDQKYAIVRKINKFLAPHNVRISLLIRTNLQQRDGTFTDKLTASNNDFYRYYIRNIGENVYEKAIHFPHCHVKVDKSETSAGRQIATQEIDFLFQQFKVDLISPTALTSGNNYDVKPSSSSTTSENVTVQQSSLNELKKKCKLDIATQESPQDDDNFQELLNMLGK